MLLTLPPEPMSFLVARCRCRLAAPNMPDSNSNQSSLAFRPLHLPPTTAVTQPSPSSPPPKVMSIHKAMAHRSSLQLSSLPTEVTKLRIRPTQEDTFRPGCSLQPWLA